MGLAFWNPACEFNYKIQYLSGSENLDLSDASSGGKLVETAGSFDFRKYILIEKSIVSGRLNVFFRLPMKGIYYFTVYSCVPTRQTFIDAQKDPSKWTHKLRFV